MNFKKMAKILLPLFAILSIASASFIGNKTALPFEEAGGVPVFIEDQITPPIDLYFIQATGAPTMINSQAAIDDMSVTLLDATGFIDGTYVGIFCPTVGRFYFGEQLGAAAGDVITLDTPLDFPFEVGDNVIPLTRDLDVNGSVTSSIFEIQGPGSGLLEVDVTRIILQMETASAVDLNKFGDLAALTDGLVLRRKDGEYRNIWNVKKNSEFANLTYDFTIYDASNPVLGIDGFSTRYSFSGKEKHGVAIRLAADEALQLIIQDDLSGLTSFRVIAQGHIVPSESGDPTLAIVACSAGAWTKVATGARGGMVHIQRDNSNYDITYFTFVATGASAPTLEPGEAGNKAIVMTDPSLPIDSMNSVDVYIYPVNDDTNMIVSISN